MEKLKECEKMWQLTCEWLLPFSFPRDLSMIRTDPLATSEFADTATPKLKSRWTQSLCAIAGPVFMSCKTSSSVSYMNVEAHLSTISMLQPLPSQEFFSKLPAMADFLSAFSETSWLYT